MFAEKTIEELRRRKEREQIEEEHKSTEEEIFNGSNEFMSLHCKVLLCAEKRSQWNATNGINELCFRPSTAWVHFLFPCCAQPDL